MKRDPVEAVPQHFYGQRVVFAQKHRPVPGVVESALEAAARLNGSDLRGADLVTAHLKATNLQGARMGCLRTGSGVRVCTDIRGATALTCEQLRRAKNWESAYRDDKMGCGGKMPVPTEAEIAHTTATHTGEQQGEGRRAGLEVWDHDYCPYERVNPRAKVTVQDGWLRR